MVTLQEHADGHVSYSTSPEWADVEPIPLIDGPPDQYPDPGPPLASIAYAPRYSEAMSYLRAIMAANEMSPRALAMTEDIIDMNPAHYTIWLYRAKILKSLWSEQNKTVEEAVAEEISWLAELSEKHLKNYQIWHHRQTIVDLLPQLPTTEVPFIKRMLAYDAKNYHVWTYRQWLCRRFPDPLLTTDIELEALEELLTNDIRNNSAWNHRYFVLFGAAELDYIEQNGGNRKTALSKINEDETKGPPLNTAVIEREIEYTKTAIRQAPNNASPWNYLRGIMKRSDQPLSKMKSFCEEFVGGSDQDPMGDQVMSAIAVDWLADIYAEEALSEEQAATASLAKDATGGSREKARRCLESLASKWDPIRARYWEHRINEMDTSGVSAVS